MIRSSNGVRLLSSHLIRDACRSIYEGVFRRNLDSGICTLSRVIGVRGGGHRTVNPNNRLLSNTSIRGSVSLSRPDYEMYNYPGWKGRTHIEGVSEKDFRKGFKNWCKRHDYIFSSEGEKEYTFNWFCDNYPYGREFFFGLRPSKLSAEKSRSIELDEDEYQGEDQEEDQVEVFYSSELCKELWAEKSRSIELLNQEGDQLSDYLPKKCFCSGCYNGGEEVKKMTLYAVSNAVRQVKELVDSQ
ncbi:hypothetical protein TSUD_347600 [Trifolium subterraneum]|nr:hypothetical protein TSUD_347600 [Trifolium subterraneum]